MTLIGKILVVLIFIMSIVFMTFTVAVYSTHRNWKTLVEDPNNGLRVRFSRAQEQLEQRRNELEELQNRLAFERAARAEALAALESRASVLGEEVKQAEVRLNQLSADTREALEGLKQAQNEMQRLKDEVDSVREEIRTTRLDRDSQLSRAVELTDRLNQGEGELRRLKERNQELVNQLSQAQLVLDRNELSIHTPVDGQPPKVEGVVTAIRDNNLVEVSVGEDEGLRRGHTLDVYRDSGGYLGRLMVLETNPDRAVTKIVPEFRQGVIRKGDRVATKLL